MTDPWATTDRLTLHRWQPVHLAELGALAVLPEIVRFVGDGSPWTPETVTAKHLATLDHWRRHDFGWLAVYDRPGAFVGLVSLTRRGATDSGVGRPAVEIGYWITPARWGRGYATEASRAATREVFARGHADLITARHLVDNPASGRLLDKLSFVRHGVTTTGDRPTYVSVLARPARSGSAAVRR